MGTLLHEEERRTEENEQLDIGLSRLIRGSDRYFTIIVGTYLSHEHLEHSLTFSQSHLGDRGYDYEGKRFCTY